MTTEESDLIIAEQNKSTEEILKAVAKIKSDYHELCKLKDMRIAELEAQVEKMKSIGRTSYIKGIRTMANALKDYDSTGGAWTDYFEHTVDKVLKKLLKEIKEK
jgi:archaellum component FlaC